MVQPVLVLNSSTCNACNIAQTNYNIVLEFMILISILRFMIKKNSCNLCLSQICLYIFDLLEPNMNPQQAWKVGMKRLNKKSSLEIRTCQLLSNELEKK